MANLTFLEKNKIEKLFEMGDGYVLDFSNRTFQELVADSTGRDMYDQKYDYASGLKANRLRAFWNKEPNHIVSKLLNDLLDYCKDHPKQPLSLHEDCRHIAQRLLQDVPVQDIDAISAVSSERDFEILAKSVRDVIEKNEPEAGLDRLHTFVVKYVRVLCEKYGIDTSREKPLHSLFGAYIKYLKKTGHIESEMTERILKSSISILEAFNFVRNEQSLAHDNPVLNYSESLLIFNNVTSSIRFITALESSENATAREATNGEDDDIPL